MQAEESWCWRWSMWNIASVCVCCPFKIDSVLYLTGEQITTMAMKEEKPYRPNEVVNSGKSRLYKQTTFRMQCARAPAIIRRWEIKRTRKRKRDWTLEHGARARKLIFSAQHTMQLLVWPYRLNNTQHIAPSIKVSKLWALWIAHQPFHIYKTQISFFALALVLCSPFAARAPSLPPHTPLQLCSHSLYLPWHVYFIFVFRLFSLSAPHEMRKVWRVGDSVHLLCFTGCWNYKQIRGNGNRYSNKNNNVTEKNRPFIDKSTMQMSIFWWLKRFVLCVRVSRDGCCLVGFLFSICRFINEKRWKPSDGEIFRIW